MTRIDDLMTPVPVVDEEVMAANIARVQEFFDGLGRNFRPHIKTHKIPELAEAQLVAGARGINCQKVTEAEVFADAGFDDILITYNILGAEKLARLAALNARVRLTVVADNATVVDGLADAFHPDRPLRILVECETGARRNGVQTPEAAVELARRITAAPGLIFEGLMTYPKPHGEAAVEAFFSETMALLDAAGLACPVRSHAGSPSLFNAADVPSATEHRAGTYIYNDRKMVREGHCRIEDCAMHILATVVSCPTPDRCVLDSGSKTLTSDLSGFADHGLIVEHPGARIVSLSEEHGVVDLSDCASRPAVGDRVRIIPNHTCVVSNMFDRMVFHRQGTITRTLPVRARGLVW
ncbi:D-TA family PLP-dependent enzyme [Oceanomicrobium pacificus]|uniref:D-TA family PLP-dependent enzyme n=1 Tax=Oceanomicrobium pacificus TaxID=2692916 RepID=A0A6B0U0I1_9RHOB|nr:D-TA family PLP-dependent enzyme [Oceanomicrobium pacificus]MXU66724.1 D-TA family PLP-dependent enzyme [Oceanomicrobium pacificus]